jgi:hypothetical protein
MSAQPLAPAAAAPLPLRDGSITVAALFDHYMAQYTGRDRSLVQRLAFWRTQVGALRLDELSDDHLHLALETLATAPARFFAGKDAGWTADLQGAAQADCGVHAEPLQLCDFRRSDLGHSQAHRAQGLRPSGAAPGVPRRGTREDALPERR